MKIEHWAIGGMLAVFLLGWAYRVWRKKPPTDIYERIRLFWDSTYGDTPLTSPFLCFSRDGAEWQSYSSPEDYMRAKTHFLFEPPMYEGNEYLIDRRGNFFGIRFDKGEGVQYPEFLKVISKEELLELIVDSQIKETESYAAMSTVEEMFENLYLRKFTYDM